MFSPRQSDKNSVADYDHYGTQWMREAKESRQLIEELKSQNEKLQRENHAVNAKLNLVYDICADMGVINHVNDLMQQKIQQSQMPRGHPNPPTIRHCASSTNESPTSPLYHAHQRFAKGDKTSNESNQGFICGSSSFQETVALSSSHEGLIKRENFRHRGMFALEESKYQDCDIFGKPKLTLASLSSSSTKSTNLSYPTNTASGDMIDQLLDSGRKESFSISHGQAYEHHQ